MPFGLILGVITVDVLTWSWGDPSFTAPPEPTTPWEDVQIYAAALAPSLVPAIVGLALGIRASRSGNRAGTAAAVTAAPVLALSAWWLAVMLRES